MSAPYATVSNTKQSVDRVERQTIPPREPPSPTGLSNAERSTTDPPVGLVRRQASAGIDPVETRRHHSHHHCQAWIALTDLRERNVLAVVSVRANSTESQGVNKTPDPADGGLGEPQRAPRA